MKTYDVKLVILANTTVCTDKALTDTEIKKLINKYGFNTILPNGDIQSCRCDEIVEFKEIKERKPK